jgi:outer membrane protein assembly factor BamB
MTKLNKFTGIACVWFAAGGLASLLYGGDWPMWRHDASHSAYTTDPLAAELHLQWVRKLPKPRPAWPPHQYKLQFDLSYEPVVTGKLLLVPSMVVDSVTAYDSDTGVEKWRFYCEGPVRFAPVAWQDKVYFVSDDGWLYCTRAADGELLWKFRGGPSDSKVLGNDRLISTWPARGAPVIYDGVVYFAAGIWPFMGTFIHALDARTGEVVWTNSAAGPMFIPQPHDEPAFSGVAPQGYMAASPDTLLVTGGRARPAAFDRATGRFRYFKHDDKAFGKFRGGCDIALWNDWFFNFDVMYRLRDGAATAAASGAVLGPDAIIGFHQDGSLMAYVPKEDGKARGLWKSALEPALDKIHVQAGPRLYGSGPDGLIAAVDVPAPGGRATVSWQGRVEGTVFTMLSADEKLFVITTSGAVYCFGPEPARPRYHELILSDLSPASPRRSEEVAAILEESATTGGYALLSGVGTGQMLSELLRRSDLHVIVLEPDADKVAAWRTKLAAAGLYGTRAALVHGDLASVELPPYFAGLALSEDPLNDAAVSHVGRLFEALRPYGGSAFLPAEAADPFIRIVQAAGLPDAEIAYHNGFLRLTRAGALPGSADWTHQYGDIANTVCSEDQLVKAPLGLLWFGDRTDFGDVLPRHGHGPPEQVVEGRLFIEGLASVAARDVYTGRTLWNAPLEDLNAYTVYYDDTFVDDFRDVTYNQVHIAGANARGANFVATADRVYVIQDRACSVLDAATGQIVRRFTIPDPLSGEPAEWAYIGVYEDYLIAGAGFAEYSRLIGPDADWLKWTRFADRLASKGLVVMDRHTGRILWSRTARFGLPHNAIAVGGGRIFCMDLLPPFTLRPAAAGSDDPSEQYRLLALDVRNGRIRWQADQDVFGGWLGYSEAHDVLIQGDWPEGDGMGPWKNFDRIIARRGKNGRVLWDEPITYNGPYILCGDRIITQRAQGKTARAFSLLTGEPIMRKHPLTGESVPWEYMRLKGCNTTVGARNLLTFRSSAAGYFDMANNGGTGNLGGFKSGCTSNLIVANGVLNAPDYTQTCTCSFQNQTSLAFVPMPAADIWTFNAIEPSDKPILRLGINFGAPGDRLAGNGTLWLDYPSVGGRSPQVEIETAGEVRYYRYDSSHVVSGPLPWVTASGAEGIEEVRIRLAAEPDYHGLYTVRLYFAEPEQADTASRMFDVTIDGRPVLEGFDVAAEAGSVRTGIVRQFTHVLLKKDVKVGFRAVKGRTIVCGIELIAETEPARDGSPPEAVGRGLPRRD